MNDVCIRNTFPLKFSTRILSQDFSFFNLESVITRVYGFAFCSQLCKFLFCISLVMINILFYSFFAIKMVLNNITVVVLDLGSITKRKKT